MAPKLVGLAIGNVRHTNSKDAPQLFLLRANHDKPGPLLVAYWSKWGPTVRLHKCRLFVKIADLSCLAVRYYF